MNRELMHLILLIFLKNITKKPTSAATLKENKEPENNAESRSFFQKGKWRAEGEETATPSALPTECEGESIQRATKSRNKMHKGTPNYC